MWTEGVNFLEILFELTIFFLLIISVVAIVRQYALPLLYGEIESIKEKEKDLKEEGRLIVSSKKRLEKEIRQQEESFFLLEKKMRLWQESLFEKNKKIEEQSKSFLKETKEKRKAQEANLRLFKMQKIVIPRSIELAYREIEKLYMGKKGAGLLKELITKIEPR